MLLSNYINQIKAKLATAYPLNETNALVNIIFRHVFRYTTHDLIINASEIIKNEKQKEINGIISRLLQHEPIQYIIGETEFFGLKFSVTPDVLIPRNETEELVQYIINENPSFNGNILDIGTGSGCIAISLMKHLKNAHVFACDISPNALKTAQKNAKMNNVDVTFFQHDILLNKESTFQYDIIVSNPPYVTEKEKDMMESNVLKHEPHTALFVPDSDPLKFYNAIASFADKTLSTNGVLWLEINEQYGKATCELLSEYGFKAIVLKDLNKRDRMIKAQKSRHKYRP
jgi:release factor glutamine methyltransferase